MGDGFGYGEVGMGVGRWVWVLGGLCVGGGGCGCDRQGCDVGGVGDGWSMGR